MIVHICEKTAWEEAQVAGEYHPRSLDTEGFIHASLPEQVLRVANRFYAGQNGLLLLWIDPQRVRAPVRYEPADGELFPHIYGALNLDAVEATQLFPCDSDGLFHHFQSVDSKSVKPDSLP
jgi:uncharacterized protein (DUF952 family)